METYFLLLLVFSALASGIHEYLEASCALSPEVVDGYSDSLKNFFKVLESTFDSQCKDPLNIFIYRRLDSSAVWSFLVAVNPLLAKEHQTVQKSFSSIKQETAECKEAVRFFTDGNVEGFCLLGIVLRTMINGIDLDGYSLPVMIPLKVVNEARKVLFMEKHYEKRITCKDHLLQLLRLNELLMPHHIKVNDYVLGLLLKYIADLRVVVIMTQNVAIRNINDTSNLSSFNYLHMDGMRDFIRVGNKLFLDRTSYGGSFILTWLHLRANVPDEHERRMYFDESMSVHDNYRKLMWLLKVMIEQEQNSWNMMALACAYDCLYNHAKLYKINIDFKRLREILLNIFFMD